MHHKRGRPKSRRAGCLLCKPHKLESRAKVPRSKRAQVILSDRPTDLALEGAELDHELRAFDDEEMDISE